MRQFTPIRSLKEVAQCHETELVSEWLGLFEGALRTENRSAISNLFVPDSHWRDVLAFTWYISPFRGADEIAASLARTQPAVQAHGFLIAKHRTQPRRVQRAGIDVIEGIFEFETAVGRGYGVVRLMVNEPSRAFQLMTNLHELKGFEERIGMRRPTGDAYSRNFGGTNWKDQRIAKQAFSDRDPTVLIVGGGQSGLCLAARLGQLDVDTLVVDKHERIGDNWRKRYYSLALHNHVDVNHLPYMPFPPTFPTYLPKDMLADWFEAYAWAMEINFWTGTEFTGARYDEASGTWEATILRSDGSTRALRPRHLVFANGANGIPRIPSLPGLENFKGETVHASQFSNGAKWRGKNVLVLGTGVSAHDVAQDLHSNGAHTTMIQRGSTTVVSLRPSAKLIYGIYDDGTPLEDADLLVATNTWPITLLNLQRTTARMVELDKELIAGLISRGFKWDIGEEKAGHQMKVRTRSGGYYLNAGCSELIISGEIGLLQFDQIDKFVAEGALLKDGSIKHAELLVFGTGYQHMQVLNSKLLGEEIANRVGTVWGLGQDGELRNMWKRTPQEGLWFLGGSFTNARVYSRAVALQIKAIEQGMLSKKR